MPYIKVFLILCVTFSTTHTWAWLDPVDFSADNGDELSTPRHAVKGYDRCDTGLGEYGTGDPPSECHRWGLVWKAGSVQTKWKPGAVATGYRLPTIKELVRLYDYTSGTGFASNPVIKSYIDTMEPALTGVEWLISSSYRDIDTRYDVGTNYSGRLQIFAINISTGEVKTFETGYRSGSGPSNDKLRLCAGLNSGSTAYCTVDDNQVVYQIIVKQTVLSEL
ncbi:MAG: hypothetical protein ACI843_001161 [Psychrobacter glaciei]|jgi:hypothetical protein